MLRADLHLHTCYSYDCRLTPQDLVARCPRVGIDCLAVTDHGSIEGALKVRELAPFPVIIGEEVRTREGEILGLFLQEAVPQGLAAREAVARIRDQGGLAGVPHPFDRYYRGALKKETLLELLPQLHFLEVFNARSFLSQDSVPEFARGHGLPGTAGSDAHSGYEVGWAYVEMPPFNGPQEFLASLAQGTVRGRHTPRWCHFLAPGRRLLKALGA